MGESVRGGDVWARTKTDSVKVHIRPLQEKGCRGKCEARVCVALRISRVDERFVAHMSDKVVVLDDLSEVRSEAGGLSKWGSTLVSPPNTQTSSISRVNVVPAKKSLSNKGEYEDQYDVSEGGHQDKKLKDRKLKSHSTLKDMVGSKMGALMFTNVVKEGEIDHEADNFFKEQRLMSTKYGTTDLNNVSISKFSLGYLDGRGAVLPAFDEYYCSFLPHIKEAVLAFKVLSVLCFLYLMKDFYDVFVNGATYFTFIKNCIIFPTIAFVFSMLKYTKPASLSARLVVPVLLITIAIGTDKIFTKLNTSLAIMTVMYVSIALLPISFKYLFICHTGIFTSYVGTLSPGLSALIYPPLH
jgi:hypothetical protein